MKAARQALGWELGELDSLTAAARPHGSGSDEAPVARLPLGVAAASELRRLARRLLAAPHRGDAAQLDGDEELDARTFAALAQALDELDELAAGSGGSRVRPSCAEMLELVGGLTVEVSAADEASLAAAVLLAAPAEIRARRFRAVFVCGLQEGEFPAPGRPEPFLSDERRRELALASGLALRGREDALERRALPVLLGALAGDRARVPVLPQLRRGGQPRAAVAVHRRRGGAARRRRGRPAAAGGCWPTSTWPPARAPTEREAERAAAAARAPLAGDPPERRAQARRRGARARPPHAGGLRRVRWSATPTARSGGWWRRELDPTPLEPEPEPLARGSTSSTRCSSALLRRARRPGDRREPRAGTGRCSTG